MSADREGYREFRTLYQISRQNGCSSVMLECPFCRSHIEAFLWSLAGGGKLCVCGAKFTSVGNQTRPPKEKKTRG